MTTVTYTIVSGSTEWAEAADLDSAIFGAQIIAEEEATLGKEFAIRTPNGHEIAWTVLTEDGVRTTSLQGNRR